MPAAGDGNEFDGYAHFFERGFHQLRLFERTWVGIAVKEISPGKLGIA